MVSSRSSIEQAGASRISVPGLGTKFWTMTSCTWPKSRCADAIASSATTRSDRDSPIPTRIPVVNGIASSPAQRSVASRRSGSLSGAPRCAARSGFSDSIIIPCDGDTRRSVARSSRPSAPAFACGSSPVSSSTACAACARYSTVEPNPCAVSHSRATGYRSSGNSPSVNSASWQPASAPARAIASTSSIDRNADDTCAGDCANVQYPHRSRHSMVSGMNTFGE